MKPMTGEIGQLSLNGEQVGGFKYWTAIQNRRTLETRVIASKFWLFKEVNSNKLQADFYSHEPNDKLELVYSAGVTIDFPEYILDKTISHSIEMNLGMFDWTGNVTK